MALVQFLQTRRDYNYLNVLATQLIHNKIHGSQQYWLAARLVDWFTVLIFVPAVLFNRESLQRFSNNPMHAVSEIMGYKYLSHFSGPQLVALFSRSLMVW